MRLQRITLRNFRGVSESTVEFSHGVTTIVGPNEVGKSSITEAIGLIREMKSSSRHRRISAVQPVHRDAGPEVELSLSTGEYELTYRKRWMKGHLTELTVHAPRREQLTGDEAHERFLAILNETVDMDLLVALELAQGDSLNQPQLAQVAALHRALDGSAGEYVSHDELLERIEQEYARYFTGTGRPTGEYRAVIADLELHRDAVDELTAQSGQIDERTYEHQCISRELEVIADELDAATQDLKATQRRNSELTRLRTAVDTSRRDLEDQQRCLADAQAARTARQELADEARSRAEAAARLQQRATLAAGDEEQAKEAADAARHELTAAEDTARDARREAAAAADALNRLRDSDDLAQALDRLEQVRGADARRREALAALENATVDEKTLARLDQLDSSVQVAAGVRSAAAATVSVRALGAHPVVVGDHALAEGEAAEQPVSEALSITIDGVVQVDIRPGETPTALDRAWREAQDALETALRQAGVRSLTEARQVAERRRQAEGDLEKAAATVEMYLRGASLDELEDKVTTLRARAADSPEPADRGSLDRAAADAQERSTAAEQAVGEARLVADRCHETFEAARLSRVKLSTELATVQQETQRVEERLARVQAEHDDAALDAATQEAEAALVHVRERLEKDQAALAAAEPESLAMWLKNAELLVEKKLRERDDLRKRIHQLDALLDEGTSEGVYDKLAEAQAALAATESRHARLGRAAEAVKFLRDTMVSHRDIAQQGYVAPFKERIDRFGRVIFGADFSVQIATDLTIESRTLNAITVPFESLSSGAKEQLALLGRLACAQLVDPREGAPVILDDALGFADPERLTALSVVLGDVGSTAQVVLLTCQPQRYASLGAAELVRFIA